MTIIDVGDLFRLYLEKRQLTDMLYIEFLVDASIQLSITEGEFLADTLSTIDAQRQFLRSTEVWVSDHLIDILRKDVFQDHYKWLKYNLPDKVIGYTFNRQQRAVVFYQEGNLCGDM